MTRKRESKGDKKMSVRESRAFRKRKGWIWRVRMKGGGERAHGEGPVSEIELWTPSAILSLSLSPSLSPVCYAVAPAGPLLSHCSRTEPETRCSRVNRTKPVENMSGSYFTPKNETRNKTFSFAHWKWSLFYEQQKWNPLSVNMGGRWGLTL